MLQLRYLNKRFVRVILHLNALIKVADHGILGFL